MTLQRICFSHCSQTDVYILIVYRCSFHNFFFKKVKITHKLIYTRAQRIATQINKELIHTDNVMTFTSLMFYTDTNDALQSWVQSMYAMIEKQSYDFMTLIYKGKPIKSW